jgi:uncharacterized membrane protein YhaH (DUF805 family)
VLRIAAWLILVQSFSFFGLAVLVFLVNELVVLHYPYCLLPINQQAIWLHGSIYQLIWFGFRKKKKKKNSYGLGTTKRTCGAGCVGEAAERKLPLA